jgi:hypothetical protein
MGIAMWFTVPIYMRSSEPLDGDDFLEETIHLIEARSDEKTMTKARLLAQRLEHRYANVHGKEVAWVLESIGDPWELTDDLKDGAEIYSRFLSGQEKRAIPRRRDRD